MTVERGRPLRCRAWSSSSDFCGICSLRACGGFDALAVWGNRVRTEKLTLLRRLLGVQPPESVESVDERRRRSGRKSRRNRWIWSSSGWKLSKARPASAAAAVARWVETYQTPRPTVAQLMQMPPNMEMPVESGPVQLHLPLSAFL